MNDDILTQATRWLLRRINGEQLSAGEQAEFERWLSAPANRREYEHLEKLRATLGEAKLVPDSMVRQILEETDPRRTARYRSRTAWSWLAQLAARPAVVATVAVILVTVVCWFGLDRPAPPATYATRFGERQAVRLSDGSRVELDGETRFEVVYSRRARDLRSFVGRAVFSVEHDAKRPFIIDAGNVRVRVVGTKFQVDRQDDRIEVTVLEGVVQVTPVAESVKAPARPVATLRAGQRVTVSGEGNFSPVEPAPATGFALWRSGKIDFRERPLDDVVREADRYFAGAIVIREGALRSLRLSGSFAIEDPVTFLFALPDILPVRVERAGQETIVISARE